MSLVSCITADMQYSMMTSDCEDKAANLTAKLKSVTEQGADLGKELSNIETQLDNAKYSYRELDSLEYQANNTQNSNALQQILGRRQWLNDQVYPELQNRKIRMEAEKKSLAAQEKELTAQQKQNDLMQKFATAASEKFGKMVEPAIKRFFG